MKMIESLNYTSFEYIHINFSLTNKLYKIIVLYRPPPKTNSNNFINEFNGLMSSLFDENRKVYVCGDFNIWAEDDTDNYAKRFLEVVGNFNETGSWSPCMRPRSDPPNFGPITKRIGW